MWDDARRGWLLLAWHGGFGSRTLRKLRQRFGNDGAAAADCSREDLISLDVSGPVTDRFLSWRNRVDQDRFIAQLEREDIRLVLPTDTEYPSYLLHTSDPPQSLFIRGAALDLKRPVAVVGTRTITNYGARVTKELVQQLASAGCEIISGLALGIDAAAHLAALEAHGKTVAVLAGGIDNASIYPRNNSKLAQRILDEGGTITSEFPPETKNMRHLFPMRNRIIAGMSTATIVIEAAESSGSLLTAKLALDENRDVFAVPGNITSEQSTGTNKLIKLGATPCLKPEDVLSLFGTSAHLQQQYPPLDLSDSDKAILKLLEQPLHADDLIRDLRLPSAEILGRLALLELHGCITHQGAQVYTRTPRGKSAIE